MRDSQDMTHVAVYVDTSGSMNSKMSVLNERGDARSFTDRFLAGTGNVRRERWGIAMNLWNSITDNIASMPLTVRTIHSKNESQTLREIGTYAVSELQRTAFPPRNGGTYLWEFLVHEGRKLITRTNKWMFILISDGMDNESTGAYTGVEGFRKCVEELQNLNIDVEFHIVGLGLPQSACDVFRQVSWSVV